MIGLLTQPVPMWLGMLLGSAVWLGLGLLSLAVILRISRMGVLESDLGGCESRLPSLDDLAGPRVTMPAPDATTSQRMAAIDVDEAIAISESKGRFGP